MNFRFTQLVHSHPEFKNVLLKDIAEKVNQKNTSLVVKRVLTNSAEFGVIDQSKFFDRKIAQDNNISNYTIVKQGDFIYNPRISSLAPCGPINKSNIKEGIASPLYTVFRIKDSKIRNEFLALYFKSNAWHSYARSVANYGARSDRMNIRNEDFFLMPIPIPNIEEQERIISFFSLLEDKINLAERTLELFEIARKATTDQIFSRQLCLKKTDGSLYGHWQEQAFPAIFTFLRTKPISRENLNGNNSPYNIHYGDILTKYDTTIDLQTDELPSISDDINMSNTDVLKEGDLIIADTAEDSSAGKSIEILNTSNQTIYAGLHTFACRPNTKFAPGFLGYYLNSSTYHNQLLRLMTGTKVLSISKAQISTTKILIPTLAEQERITTLLNNLREKTRIQRKKLCALKALKNALLQQMFV